MSDTMIIESVKEAVAAEEFEGLTNALSGEEYHRLPGLNFSGLKDFAESPAYYDYWRKEPPEAPTDSQRLGTLVHMLVLEPQRVTETVSVVDGTWAGKVKEEVQKLQSEGKYVCKSKELNRAKRMAEAIVSHPDSKALLTNGLAEQSVFWRDPESGLYCKARPDYLREDLGLIVDLKFYKHLSTRQVARQIMNMQYHWQAAHYLAGATQVLGKPVTRFAYVMVSEDEPHLVRCFELHHSAIDKAMAEMDPQIRKYAECKASGVWPGYSGIEVISLPDYAWSQDLESES